jgi:tetratricopeptide (TPR) repeat protein
MLETLQSLGYLAPHATRQSMGGMDPKDGIGIYNLLENARHHAQGRRWRDAEVLLRQIIDKVPRHVSARNVLGLALARQGRLAEAKDEYLQSLAVDTTQHRVVALLGSVAMLQGEMDEAKQRFEQALAMSPQFVEAMVNLGLIAAMRNDGHEAQRWYQAAIDVDAGFPTPYKRTGDLYFEQGDFARALEHYRKTLTIAPNHFQALIQAGEAAARFVDSQLQPGLPARGRRRARTRARLPDAEPRSRTERRSAAGGRCRPRKLAGAAHIFGSGRAGQAERKAAWRD